MSAYVVPNEATHALVSVIEFSDGGEPSEMVMQFGTFEECDAAARLIPAVSYNGDRPTKAAHLSVRELFPVCGVCGSRHDGECAVTSSSLFTEEKRR